jgi:hypothetical protein
MPLTGKAALHKAHYFLITAGKLIKAPLVAGFLQF